MKQTLWVIDSCPDANGYWTIRNDDGSIHGDTNSEPIATVYDHDVAVQIVQQHNTH